MLSSMRKCPEYSKKKVTEQQVLCAAALFSKKYVKSNILKRLEGFTPKKIEKQLRVIKKNR